MKKFISYLLLLSICYIILQTAFSLRSVKVSHVDFAKNINYSSVLTAGGEFESQNNSDVILSYPIWVEKVYVKENDYVNKGQLILSVDMDKMESLAAGNISSDIIENTSSEDLAVLASKNYSYKNLSDFPKEIYAAESGVITELNVSNDTLAISGKSLCSILSGNSILAKLTLSQADYGKVSVNDKVVITPVAFSDVNHTAHISDKNAVVRRETTALGSKVVVDVFAVLDSPDGRVGNGLQINAKIKSADEKSITAVKYETIKQDEGGEYVFILKNGKAEKVYVQTGLEGEDFVELLTAFPEKTVFLISDNLSQGDYVIVGGAADNAL